MDVIRAELAKLSAGLQALNEAAQRSAAGLPEDEASKRFTAAYEAQKKERDAIRAALAPLDKELGALDPSAQRRSFVWLYTNTTGQ